MNPTLLNDYQKKSGKTKTFLAKKLDVSRPTIYKIFEKPSIATYWQVETLSSELNIESKDDKAEIFLP